MQGKIPFFLPVGSAVDCGESPRITPPDYSELEEEEHYDGVIYDVF